MLPCFDYFIAKNDDFCSWSIGLFSALLKATLKIETLPTGNNSISERTLKWTNINFSWRPEFFNESSWQFLVFKFQKCQWSLWHYDRIWNFTKIETVKRLENVIDFVQSSSEVSVENQGRHSCVISNKRHEIHETNLHDTKWLFFRVKIGYFLGQNLV